THTDLLSAVNSAEAGDTIRIQDDQNISSTIVINKTLIIRGNGQEISTSGGSQLLTITSAGAGTLIQGLNFLKTDNVSQNFSGIQADNVRIINNTFQSQWNIGDSEVVRGLVVSPGTNGYDIRNNEFVHLRQP